MHMAHKSENTSGVSKSSSDWLNYTGFPGDVCVTFFNVMPGNKDAVTPNPLTKEESIVFTTVTMSAYQDQLNAGFSKVCEIFKVLHTSLLLWRHFHVPKRDAERNELWLVVWHVLMASWAGLGQWKLPWFPDLQPSVWRSGYARPRLINNCLCKCKGWLTTSSLLFLAGSADMFAE